MDEQTVVCTFYVQIENGYHCSYWEEDNPGCDGCNWENNKNVGVLLKEGK
jgi:hypothetical protein